MFGAGVDAGMPSDEIRLAQDDGVCSVLDDALRCIGGSACGGDARQVRIRHCAGAKAPIFTTKCRDSSDRGAYFEERRARIWRCYHSRALVSSSITPPHVSTLRTFGPAAMSSLATGVVAALHGVEM